MWKGTGEEERFLKEVLYRKIWERERAKRKKRKGKKGVSYLTANIQPCKGKREKRRKGVVNLDIYVFMC